MSSVILPPDPCLLSIILITCSRAGPRFVYHYPPTFPLDSPSSRRSSGARANVGGADSNLSTDGEEASSSEDDEPEDQTAGLGATRPTDRTIRRPSSGSQTTRSSTQHQEGPLGSPAVEGDGGLRIDRRPESPGERQIPPWDVFLDIKTDVWEKLLCPASSWHKRRFEVGVNDLSFVGWPVFVKDDGSWRKKKKKKKIPPEHAGMGISGLRSMSQADRTRSAKKVDGFAYFQGSRDVPDGPSRSSTESTTGDEHSSLSENGDSMTMFNVVFVMNPPILEHNQRIKENYDNVIKKFGKGLKFEQATANYVWKEAQTITHIKDRARENRSSMSELYDQLLSKSSLAQAIATIYDNISTSKIASITLTPRTTMSLQIPPLTSTPYLPGPTEPSYPGLWLTTADSLSAADEVADDANAGQSKVLAKHFALLLLSDETTILKDIENSMGTLGPPLAHYIRSSKPTKSFAQIATTSSIPLSDIQVLATHLIYWRRARAVPPLNKQDTYIVSPNCDLSKLAVATTAYEAAFPTLPSLAKMLTMLSGVPRPYSSFIPSRDHKGIYYDILAWLMRGGWVTQLRTFGWIKVDPEIKKEADEAIKREEDLVSSTATIVRAIRPQPSNDTSSSSSSLDSDNSSGTPVPGRHAYFHEGYLNRRSSPRTSSLILRPQRASPIEGRWLDEIISRFPDDCISEIQNDGENSESEAPIHKYWSTLTKYFNGTDALEKIAVREGLSRKLASRLLTRIDINESPEDSDVNSQEKVLLTVRHW
ncbi:Nitrogen permease regulator 3 [Ophidiomyces ophidiicola]|nr:Nitrogen permease regulator 3 [Ophidiomyces ophidiicola]